VRDWEQYVRTHLSLPGLARERESRILRELSSQLEDFYREAVAGGMTEAQADAHARAQITDWTQLAATLTDVDRPHVRGHIDSLVGPPGRSRTRETRQVAHGG
jgi:hypothetical protein